MTAPSSIDQKVDAVIQDYQRNGYEILSCTAQADFPEFLREYGADVIAKNEHETVVIEVKTRSTLKDPNLSKLAEEIEAYPGWRLDLVVLPESSPLIPISVAQIRDRIIHAQQLRETDQQEAALLLIWSAIEAILRQIAVKEEIELQNNSIISVITTFFSLGLIDQPTYQVLKQASKLRSAIAHGLQSQEEANPNLLDQLLEIAQQLLQEIR
jgi:hypothetical protein